MEAIFKYTGAKITQTHALTKGKGYTGGKMTRLRCGNLTPKQEVLFSSKKEWSIAMGTEWGIIPTLFYVKPKAQGKNNQNSIKIRELNIQAKGKLPSRCPNFDSKNPLFDIIRHYCPEWKIAENPKDRPSIFREFHADFLMLEDRYSKRGLLILYNPEKKIQLSTLSLKSNMKSKLIESINYHLAKIGFIDNVEEFLKRWYEYISQAVDEKAIEQKRDDLERIGIEAYFKRSGVDAPATKIILIIGSRKIEFNIDVELKHDASIFFKKTEASNIRKYPHLPLLIICNKDSSNESDEQYILHPTISLLDLFTTLRKELVTALPILRVTEEEIARLNAIVDAEAKDIKKIPIKDRKKTKVV